MKTKYQQMDEFRRNICVPLQNRWQQWCWHTLCYQLFPLGFAETGGFLLVSETGVGRRVGRRREKYALENYEKLISIPDTEKVTGVKKWVWTWETSRRETRPLTSQVWTVPFVLKCSSCLVQTSRLFLGWCIFSFFIGRHSAGSTLFASWSNPQ